MTVYEHAMAGVSLALAAGLHRRHGWGIAAPVGVAAALPDWDRLPSLFGARDMGTFASFQTSNVSIFPQQ